MSYYEDELAPPSGDFANTLIRAASLSALLLTACSDSKPAAPKAKVTAELNRPAKSVPEFTFASSATPTEAQPKMVIAHPRKVAKIKPVMKADSVRAAVAAAVAAPTVTGALDMEMPQSLVTDAASETIATALAGTAPAIAEPASTPTIEIPPDNSSQQEVTAGDPPASVAETAASEVGAVVEVPATDPAAVDLVLASPEPLDLIGTSLPLTPTATESVAEHPPVETTPETAQPVPQAADAEPVALEAADARDVESQAVMATASDDALPTIPNRHIVQALAATFTAVGWYDANRIAPTQMPSVTERSATPDRKDEARAEGNIQPAANTTLDPDVPPDVETESEWEERMQTSAAPPPEDAPRAPKNFSTESFAQNSSSDNTGNTLTLSLAALGDIPISGFLVTESIGDTQPSAPAANDPDWQAVEAAGAYGGEHAYVLRESYADSTPVKLHVWFKDSIGQVSPPVQSVVTVHRSHTELASVSNDNPYVVDTAVGFKDWTYRRGANQMGSATQGRAKARADADNYFLGPPIQLSGLEAEAALVLQLRQWYQYDADVSVYDGARPTIEIATAQSPGVWSEWTSLRDPDKSTSILWTAPRFDLSPYAGTTIKLRIGIVGNLRSLADWGLSDLSIAVETPVKIVPHSAYTEGFEADWNGWSARLAQWSIGGPGLNGKVAAPEGLYHANAAPLGAETGNFALDSPIFQLPEAPVELSFSEWHNFKYGEGKLQISYFDRVTGWREWSDLGRAITGRSSDWQTVRADLTPYAGLRVRLRLLAHLTPSDTAWRIDEFQLASP